MISPPRTNFALKRLREKVFTLRILLLFVCLSSSFCAIPPGAPHERYIRLANFSRIDVNEESSDDLSNVGRELSAGRGNRRVGYMKVPTVTFLGADLAGVACGFLGVAHLAPTLHACSLAINHSGCAREPLWHSVCCGYAETEEEKKRVNGGGTHGHSPRLCSSLSHPASLPPTPRISVSHSLILADSFISRCDGVLGPGARETAGKPRCAAANLLICSVRESSYYLILLRTHEINVFI